MTFSVHPGASTPTWAELTTQAARLEAVPVRELFERDPGRYERFVRERAGLLLDFSRQRLDEIALAKLVQLADNVGLRERIDAMWRGEHINTTEDRAVLHVALRQPPGAAIGGAQIEALVMAERARMLVVRRGRARRRHPWQRRRALPAGGQHRHRRLGPRPGDGRAGAARLHRRGAALRVRLQRRRRAPRRGARGRRPEDHAVHRRLQDLHDARDADQRAGPRAPGSPARLGEAAVPQHFAAVSVNHQAMDAFGVHPEYRFQMWDWVGGRYSMWSSIGVSLAIAIGGV